MQKYRTRNELRNLVIESFSKEVEINSIYFFGKEVNNKSDEYSDIDMIICSSDLAKTQSKYLEILNGISPIIGSFILNSTENDFSQMVMLKDFSPYQKIDFSITDSIETKKLAGFGPFISIYKDNSITDKVNSKLKIIKQNNVRNQLDDFLFTVPRFTKCLFRKDYDMYRRWKNISDYTMALLYEKYFGWKEKTSRDQVPVKQLSELNKSVNSDEKEILNRIFPSSGIVNVAESYKFCIEFLITLCKQKADYFKVELNADFIMYMERFLHSEITRYIETIQ
jgi:predicted nucleotidyltransferase